MNVSLSAIQRDVTIQCRADINMDTVCEYAEQMTEGAEFPPVELYGTAKRCWIGDGWHRVMAAEKIEARDIPATLHSGGRAEALKHALRANAVHGLKRSNADKRRCVEIALREFPALSSRAIAELCGVGDQLVRTVGGNDDQLRESRSSTLMGKDGKERPARMQRTSYTAPEDPDDIEGFKEEDAGDHTTPIQENTPEEAPARRPGRAMEYAAEAITAMRKIKDNDSSRAEAFATVKKWVTDNE